MYRDTYDFAKYRTPWYSVQTTPSTILLDSQDGSIKRGYLVGAGMLQ
jgi:hypothetical protein